MAGIAKWVIDNALSAKWLSGHRTKVIAVALFALAGARAAGWIHLDDKTYADLVQIISGAGLLTAAAHKPA